MKTWIAGVILLAIVVGLIFGILLGFVLPEPSTAPAPADRVYLDAPEQDDYIIMVAEAYSAEHNLKLANDRLDRLGDEDVSVRVEQLANTYAPQRDLIATNLAMLAVALGSRSRSLLALSLSPTATNTRTPIATLTSSRTATPRATATAPDTATPKPTRTLWVVVITNTPTPSPRATRTPMRTATQLPTPTPTATDTPRPPPPTGWEPGLDQWWGGIYYQPVEVQPGQGYWHLAKAVYCDAFDNSDPHRHDFGCSEMPGGSQGTSIYVMTGGAAIDVIAPDGRNVGDDPAVIGDLKSPNDMCQCTYAFESSNYRISVRGAPSDAIGGFCLCSHNFGWGSRAHVRYFLYFEYITR